MLPVAAFGFGLGLCSLLAWRMGHAGMGRTAAAMTANWIGVLLAVWLSGSFTPWGLFFALDVATAFVVLRQPASKPQAIIGMIYVSQLTFHVAYALVGSAAASLLYLDLLALGGWLQICTLFWGAIHGGGMRYSDTYRARGRLPAADPTDTSRVGPGK
jgi:hypothetical protein